MLCFSLFQDKNVFFTFSGQEYIKLLLDSLWVWDGKDHKPPTQTSKNKTNQKKTT